MLSSDMKEKLQDCRDHRDRYYQVFISMEIKHEEDS
jgi:hypothetical protein